MSDDILEVLTKPTVSVVLAGRVLGVGPRAARNAVKNGTLPAVRVGSQFRVPTIRLREMLGLPATETAAA